MEPAARHADHWRQRGQVQRHSLQKHRLPGSKGAARSAARPRGILRQGKQSAAESGHGVQAAGAIQSGHAPEVLQVPFQGQIRRKVFQRQTVPGSGIYPVQGLRSSELRQRFRLDAPERRPAEPADRPLQRADGQSLHGSSSGVESGGRLSERRLLGPLQYARTR